MATKRRTRTTVRKNILLLDIKYDSTCIILDLPHTLCCDNCKNEIESCCGLLKKSSKKKKDFVIRLIEEDENNHGILKMAIMMKQYLIIESLGWLERIYKYNQMLLLTTII